MHTVRRLVGAAVVMVFSVSLSCNQSAQPETECSQTTEPALLAEFHADTIGDWRDSVERLIESVPPDSVVRLAVVYVSKPTEQDRQFLLELEATIIYEFQGLHAFGLGIRADRLGTLAGSERVLFISVGAEAFPLGCN